MPRLEIREISRVGLAKGKTRLPPAFMGVSICSHFFSNARLRAIAGWAENRFEQFLFLIADEPQAHTFVALQGDAEDAAKAKARRIGDERTIQLQRVVQRARTSRCVVRRWQDVAAQPLFRSVEARVNSCFSTDSRFRRDVIRQVDLRATIDDRDYRSIQDRWRLIAVKYVIDELSAMLFLQSESEPRWPIQVFPGPMPFALRGMYRASYQCPSMFLSREESGYLEISATDAVQTKSSHATKRHSAMPISRA